MTPNQQLTVHRMTAGTLHKTVRDAILTMHDQSNRAYRVHYQTVAALLRGGYILEQETHYTLTQKGLTCALKYQGRVAVATRVWPPEQVASSSPNYRLKRAVRSSP